VNFTQLAGIKANKIYFGGKLRIKLTVLTMVMTCFAFALSCSSGVSKSGGRSDTGSFTLTINGTKYTGRGFGGFSNAVDNVIQIADTPIDESYQTNTMQVNFATSTTATTYTATGDVPSIIYYPNGALSAIPLDSGSVTFTSVAASTGEHTTGTFTGSCYIGINLVPMSGSFDEIR